MKSIPKKETLTVEFKSDLRKLGDSELIDAVVAMANTDGGTLYLGVEDDGKVSGVNKIHADATGVVALIANRTVPSVSVRAEIITENNKDVLKIEIYRSRAIVASSDGRILRRRLKLDGSPENVPMYPFEITTRLSDLSQLDFSAQIISDATIDDLDPNERIRLRNILKMRKSDSSLNDLTDEELDKALQLVRSDNGVLYPTVTGMLLIGKEDRLKELIPTAKSCFQVLVGTQVRVNELFSKPLLLTFEIFESYMKAWNPEREIQYGLIRIPIPEFSDVAFREGLVNAFCHRDYSILQVIRLAIEDEGLTISSPGGFIEGVNLNNLLTVEPHGRNQTLADALKRIGLAERTGRGIDRIFESSIMYGRPIPDYSESTESCVKLFIQRAQPDLAFVKMLSDEEERTGQKLPINSLLILSTLRTQRRASIHELCEAIHLSEARIRANIEKLLEAGLVEAKGEGRSRTYILSSKVYREQGDPIGYVRQSGIDKLRYDELVMTLAKNQGYITRDDVVQLLRISESQAYRILKRLSSENRILLEGTGRSAKYRVADEKSAGPA